MVRCCVPGVKAEEAPGSLTLDLPTGNQAWHLCQPPPPPRQVVTSLPAHKQPGQPGASLLTCDLTEPWRLEVFHVGMNGVGRGRKALKSSDCGSRLHGSIGSRHLARTVGRSVPVQLCRNQLACSLPGDMCVRVHVCVLTPLPAGTAVWWFS